jgi:hypothetical protein
VTSSTEIPSFHDGYFDGIRIEPNKQVQFFLRTVSEQSFVLILEGVERLVLTDVRAGNIILDLVIRATEQLTHSDMEELYGMGNDTPQVSSLLKTATERGLQVLEINPSYGAQGLVLFQNWNLSQQKVNPQHSML